jgi:hypothetical protein
MVVDSRVVDDLFLIDGLRDRLAEAPERVLSGPIIGVLRLTFVLETYLAMGPVIVERRAIRRLRPSVIAHMSVQESTLVVTGAANVPALAIHESSQALLGQMAIIVAMKN